MRLVGKLNSPYVRRVAVSLHLLDMPFERDDLSVLRDVPSFMTINPVIKAPTLVADDGTTLMDSTLILEVVEHGLPPERRLTPAHPAAFLRHQRIVGLALAACEKTVQIVYENRLRPEEKRHQPWLDRVGGQLDHAYALLEADLAAAAPWLFGDRPLQADVTAAVAWQFTQGVLPGRVSADRHPRLAALSAKAEALPAFRAADPA